jgi:hypothetical protein
MLHRQFPPVARGSDPSVLRYKIVGGVRDTFASLGLRVEPKGVLR